MISTLPFPDLLHMRIPRSISLAFGLLLMAGMPAGWAETVRDGPVTAELIAEPAWLTPGTPAWVGVRLRMDEGWHTYWKNPGDAGMATRIRWTLPEGFSAGQIHWPYPRRIPVGSLVSFGYEGDVVLISDLAVDHEVSEGSVELSARVDWVACKEICVKGQAQLALPLEARKDAPTPNAAVAELFEKARAAWPTDSERWMFVAYRRGPRLFLTGRPGVPPDSFAFFPDQAGLIDHNAPQVVKYQKGAFTLVLVVSPDASAAPTRLTGVLVAESGWGSAGDPKALLIDVPLQQ